jgi:hypothetical protein
MQVKVSKKTKTHFMFNYRKSMETHLTDALQALKRDDVNTGLTEVVMALQEMSGRFDAIEEKLGVAYDEE